MSLVLLGLISSLLVQHQVMMRRRSLVTMVRQESMSLEENVIEKVIEFISKCICVFGEAHATCLVLLSLHPISRLPKNFPILLGPSLTRSLVQIIPFFHQIPYVLRDNWIWFVSYLHCPNGGMVFQARQKQIIESSLSSSESLRSTVSRGIWAMSVAYWSAL